MKIDNKLNDINAIQEIITYAEHLKLINKAPFIIAEYIFTENILKEIDEYKILFQEVIIYYIKQRNLIYFHL